MSLRNNLTFSKDIRLMAYKMWILSTTSWRMQYLPSLNYTTQLLQTIREQNSICWSFYKFEKQAALFYLHFFGFDCLEFSTVFSRFWIYRRVDMIRQRGYLFRADATWFTKSIFTLYTPMMILGKWNGGEGEGIVVKIFFLIISNRRRSRTLFDCLLFDVEQVKLLRRATLRQE
jgi:hypothetical protein